MREVRSRKSEVRSEVALRSCILTSHFQVDVT
jgi:hypothetical protein